MKTISVITTTRFRRRKDHDYYLEHALRSAASQLAKDVKFEHILGINEGDDLPEQFHGMLFEEAKGLSSAANAALRAASGDYIALLEDDDQWEPNFITQALTALERFDFVSSTSLEIDEDFEVVRINDFPIPSGWLMPRKTFETVGYLDETLATHQDNDWLGRLTRTGLNRVHLVESTAPVMSGPMGCRPWLQNVARVSALGRHPSPLPLVVRTVHPQSELWNIQTDKQKRFESNRCYAQLTSEYGEIPW